MARPVAIVFSVWCWLVTLVLTLFFGTLAILTSWVPPRGRLYLVWARAWARGILALSRLRVRVEIAPEAAGAPAAVYMANHESTLDILVALVAIRANVRFLAKREIFFVPILGWSMWLAGFIPVDRERKEKAREVLDALADRLAHGASVLVFPEGTRSRDGRLAPFKKSGFLLALKKEIPIVPIGISGSRPLLGAHGLLVTPGEIVVRLGPPVPTAGLGISRRAELMERVRAEIARLRSAS